MKDERTGASEAPVPALDVAFSREVLTAHALTSAELAAHFKVDPRSGFAEAEAVERLARFSPNTLPEPRGRSLLKITIGQLQSPLIYLLLVTAVVSLLLGEFDDAAFIFVVLGINTAIGAFQEIASSRS
jgi:magnesium-transporting ATPase (P-type)